MKKVYKNIINTFSTTILPVINNLSESVILRKRGVMAVWLFSLLKLGETPPPESLTTFVNRFENDNEFYEWMMNYACTLSINGLLTVSKVYRVFEKELSRRNAAVKENIIEIHKYVATLSAETKLRIVSFGCLMHHIKPLTAAA